MERAMTDVTEARGFNLGDASKVLATEEDGIEIHMEGADRKPLFFANGSGEPKPVTWTVAGRYSARYRRAEEAANRITRDVEDPDKIPAAVLAAEREKATLCVISWDGMFEPDGKPLKFSAKVVRGVINDYPWVLHQVQRGMNDHAGFTRAALGT